MTATVYNANSEPIKNSAFTFSVALVSQADTDIFKTSPTLAAGDVKVRQDGGSFANITTLPTGTSTGVMSVALSAAEMNGNIVDVLLHDDSGSEWQDILFTIFTKVAVNVGTSDLTAALVWSELTSGLITVGSIGKLLVDDIDAKISSRLASGSYSSAPTVSEIWSTTIPSSYAAGSAGYVLGNLKCSDLAVDAQSVVAGSDITKYRDTTWVISITGLGTLANHDKIWFAVKRDFDDPDTQAILQVEHTGGLLYIAGQPGTAADATLVIDDEASGNITVTVKASSQVNVDIEDDLHYDVKLKRTSGTEISLLTRGMFNVAGSSTRTV